MDFCNFPCIVFLIRKTTSINHLINIKRIPGSVIRIDAQFRQFSLLKTSGVYTSVRENCRELSSLLHAVVIGPTKRLIAFQHCCVCI